MEPMGLKPTPPQNTSASSAWVSYLRQPWSVLAINDSLAIERRGGRGGGGPPMPERPVDRGQRPWNKGLLIGQKKPPKPKHVWSIRVRLEIARSRRDLAIFIRGDTEAGDAREVVEGAQPADLGLAAVRGGAEARVVESDLLGRVDTVSGPRGRRDKAVGENDSILRH